MLRVSPTSSDSQGQPPVLRIDSSKKRVSVMEPFGRNHQRATMTLGRDGKTLHKSFSLDCAYPAETSQVCFPQSLCVVFISLLFGCLFISMLTPSNSHTYNCGEFIVCHQDSTCVPLVVGGPQFESTKALFYHVTLILMNNSSFFVTVAVFACSSVN